MSGTAGIPRRGGVVSRHRGGDRPGDREQAGIVVAFPQRDVHLDTKGPIEVKVLRGES